MVQWFRRTAFGLTALVAGIAPAYAGMEDYSLFRSGEFQQTGTSTVVPFNGGTNYFFAAVSQVSSPSDFDSMTLTDPLSTTHALTGPVGTTWSFQTGFMTKSALDTQFPAGIYNLDAANGSGENVSVNLNYDGTDRYSAPPTLTSATFSALSGMDPHNAFMLSFDPFTPDPSTNTDGIFVTITGPGDTTVFSAPFLSPSTTSVVIPADTLLPNTAYQEELIFSSRIDNTDGATIDCMAAIDPANCPGRTELGWDSRTITDFTTGSGLAAVPEPDCLSVIGLAGLGLMRRRSKAT